MYPSGRRSSGDVFLSWLLRVGSFREYSFHRVPALYSNVRRIGPHYAGTDRRCGGRNRSDFTFGDVGEAMRIHGSQLGAVVSAGPAAFVSSDPGIVPPNLYPATLPSGYAGTLPTGVIPGNETGETQPPGGGCDPQTDPNCFTQLQILNICQTGGGTWDYGTQTCTPPKTKTDYTPIFIASGIALIALLMVVLGGRR